MRLSRRTAAQSLFGLALTGAPPAHARQVAESARYAPGARGALDIYAPDNAEGAPVIVFFYGGGWQFGEKARIRPAAEAIAAKGFIVIVPDYRVFPEVTFPAFVEDAAAAIAWTHQSISIFGGDPSRIVLMGHSAGAHIAALAALDRTYLDAARVPRSAIRGLVGVSGPYYHPRPYRDQRWCEIFCPAGDLGRTEPMHFVSADAPPLLLLVGDHDTAVPPIAPMVEAVRAAGGQADFKIYPGVDHGGTFRALTDPSIAPVLADTADFVRRVTA